MFKLNAQALKDLFRGRKLSYSRVFDENNQFTGAVLRDLAKFCRAHDPCFHSDPRIHAMLEGRREVWLRIQNYLNLSEDELFQLHVVKSPEGV